jgi:hypothetical protein
MDALAAVACEIIQSPTDSPRPFPIEDDSDPPSPATLADNHDENGPAMMPTKRKPSGNEMDSCPVPNPPVPVDDDSNRERPLPGNPTPIHHGEDGEAMRVGDVTTSTKRKLSREDSHRKRKKLRGGLRCNSLDTIAFQIDEKHFRCVSLPDIKW